MHLQPGRIFLFASCYCKRELSSKQYAAMVHARLYHYAYVLAALLLPVS